MSDRCSAEGARPLLINRQSGRCSSHVSLLIKAEEGK